jgi:2-phosphosulfolactate phosphatase
MPRQLRVHLLPDLADPHDLAGNVHVVIDILRATTTIAHAIAAGAEQILPCLEVAEAREQAGKLQNQRVLLGGERDGVRINGFDLGNSPAEYQTERIKGATVCFTTTNGTRAMMRCLGAERVLIGSFVNLSAVDHAIQKHDQIELVCAGTRGQITREDVLFAGALVAHRTRADSSIQTNDAARLALDAWQAIGGDDLSDEQLSRELAQSQGGRNLAAIGMQFDIQAAAKMDAVDVLPELRTSDWKIVDGRG